MKTKSRIFPMPSPSGRNAEGLFIKQTILTRSQLGQDTIPSMARALATSENGGRIGSDPRGPGRSGEIEGGVWRECEDTFDLPGGSPGLAQKRETMPPQNTHSGEVRETLSGEDEFNPEEEESLQAYASDMRKRGSDAEVIDHAMRMTRDILRRHRSGHDQLSLNRIGSRDREAPNGGHFGGSRSSGQMANGAMDATAKEIARARQMMSRIEHVPEVRNPDKMPLDRRSRRAAMDSAPGAARVADLHKLIPGLALIGSVAGGDGPGLASHKNPYEV